MGERLAVLATAPKAAKGHATPRIAPPRPVRSTVKEFKDAAAECGIVLMPWQVTAATYIEATSRGHWQWPDVAVIVARQNGKSELLVPFVVRRLLMGRRIMHAAQNRALPRQVFSRVAELMLSEHRSLLKRKPRFANGQEEITLTNGGSYRIVAATRGAARGWSGDDLIIDELREIDEDFIAAAEPTISASLDPQTLYLSNAGDDESIVLNSVRARADSDPSLAYLEWSADPKRDISDRDGWLEANPAVGNLPGRDLMGFLERKYESYRQAGTLSIYETEHLCRWVPSMRERMVDEYAWAACHGPLGDPRMPVMAVSMTPDGKRAAAAMAWQRIDGSVALRLLYDVTGNPIDVKRLGEDIDKDAKRLGIRRTAYDPLTDAELAKYLRKPEKVTGQEWANASAQFVNLVTAKRLRWQDDGSLSEDLAWTSRKAHDETGHFTAVRMADDRPIPAALASIRAVWLASGPSASSPRVF